MPKARQPSLHATRAEARPTINLLISSFKLSSDLSKDSRLQPGILRSVSGYLKQNVFFMDEKTKRIRTYSQRFRVNKRLRLIIPHQDRNNLVYCVSCQALAIATRGKLDPISSKPV